MASDWNQQSIRETYGTLQELRSLVALRMDELEQARCYLSAIRKAAEPVGVWLDAHSYDPSWGHLRRLLDVIDLTRSVNPAGKSPATASSSLPPEPESSSR
jgi:hypothetical protein